MFSSHIAGSQRTSCGFLGSKSMLKPSGKRSLRIHRPKKEGAWLPLHAEVGMKDRHPEFHFNLGKYDDLLLGLSVGFMIQKGARGRRLERSCKSACMLVRFQGNLIRAKNSSHIPTGYSPLTSDDFLRTRYCISQIRHWGMKGGRLQVPYLNKLKLNLTYLTLGTAKLRDHSLRYFTLP